MSDRERLRDGSVVATAAERTARRLRTAAATARVGRLVQPLVGSRGEGGDGTDADGEPRPTGAIRRLAARSTVAKTLRRTRARIGSTVGTAAANARLTAAGDAIGRVVRGSVCYRWLTAEPDPDVIVIDLRETLTVGPPLRAIQRSLEALAPSVATARLAAAGRAVASTLRARPVRVAGLALLGAVGIGMGALAASGDPGPVSVAALVALALLAAVGVRSRATWEDVRESRIVSALAAAFEPPEPPARTGADTADGAERPSSRSIDARDDDARD